MNILATILLVFTAFAGEQVGPIELKAPPVPSADKCTENLATAWRNYLWSKKQGRSEKYLAECAQRIVTWQALTGYHRECEKPGCRTAENRRCSSQLYITTAVLESSRCSKTEPPVDGWPCPVPVEIIKKENP